MQLPRATLVRLKKLTVWQADVPVTIEKSNARCGFTTIPSPCMRFNFSPIESKSKERGKREKIFSTRIVAWKERGSVTSLTRGG